ncbi:MAG: hypothetical protein GX027_04505 [Clostridiaceae bacterium]|jgi:hypothetical protein|nr:hypothetical protein [Clostridiaceae bacterium]
MMRLKYFLLGRRGLNTVEVIVILAVILGIALLFRNEIVGFVNDLIQSIFKQEYKQPFDPSNIAATPTTT